MQKVESNTATFKHGPTAEVDAQACYLRDVILGRIDLLSQADQ